MNASLLAKGGMRFSYTHTQILACINIPFKIRYQKIFPFILFSCPFACVANKLFIY